MISNFTGSLPSITSSAVLAVGVFVVSCSSSTTIGPGTVTDAGSKAPDSGLPATVGDSGTPTTGGSCAVDTGNDACGVCIGQKCCAQVTACSKDADCVALDGCLQNCPQGAAGQSCADSCYTAHPTGAKVSDTIDACAATNCKAACPTG